MRINSLMKCVLENETVTNYYKFSINKFKSSCYTYIALHLALTKKHKREAINYLLKGLKEDGLIIFSKRFYAILKHLIN